MVIYQKLFSRITNLTAINLNYNRIYYIEEGTFVKLSNLRMLYLAGNDLNTLRFLSSATLYVLDVGFNKFSNMIIDRSTIIKILIYPNPWKCVVLFEFWEFCRNNDIEFDDSLTLRKPDVYKITLMWMYNGNISGQLCSIR